MGRSSRGWRAACGRGARALWDEVFADGFPGGDGPQVALWSFSHGCMLELGRVPAAVELALHPDTERMLLAYKEARLAAWRAGPAAEPGASTISVRR